MTEKGKKFDKDKPQMDLIPALAALEVGRVMGKGGDKYGRYNWLGGLRCTRIVAAALRHIFQWLSGETLDKETGCNHLAHAACCCLMALETQIRKPKLDDRFKDEEERKDKCPTEGCKCYGTCHEKELQEKYYGQKT